MNACHNDFHHNHTLLILFLCKLNMVSMGIAQSDIKLQSCKDFISLGNSRREHSIKGDRATLLCALNAISSTFPLEWWLQGYLLFFCWLLVILQVSMSEVYSGMLILFYCATVARRLSSAKSLSCQHALWLIVWAMHGQTSKVQSAVELALSYDNIRKTDKLGCF